MRAATSEGTTGGTVRSGGPGPTVTVVVPTCREVENIPHLAERVRAVRASAGLDLDLVFMDDDSRDGSEDLVRSLGLPWVQMVVRTTDRGLSRAVLDGLRSARGEVLVVMDADLSHPPETIPAMIRSLEDGNEVAVGSRFVAGGSTDDDWGVFRWLNSRIATLLAMPLTSLKDPMSGFFAIRRSTFKAGRDLNPIGYKILLELLVKCGCQRVVEIPIHFADRHLGKSKLSVREQLRYVQHLRRLYIHKYGGWSHLAQFLVVGASGLAVNLLALTALLGMGVWEKVAVATAIGVSMIWNFVLNRRFSFSYARGRSVAIQFIGFVAACSLGAAVNYGTTVAVWEASPYKQVAAAIGVLAGTAFNFVMSRFLVFRMEHVRPESRSTLGAG
jgi:dolichol-phosphate mannosyltransferase